VERRLLGCPTQRKWAVAKIRRRNPQTWRFLLQPKIWAEREEKWVEAMAIFV
jgi:hypothetical protein